MPTAQVLHLLPSPPLATPPDPSTIISLSTPADGVLTTSLLDPAVPSPVGSQVRREVQVAGTLTAGTYHFILGRFLTRPLPAQTIGAGTWKLAAAVRQNASGAGTYTVSIGCCIASWRPGTGVITRIADNTAFSNSVNPSGLVAYDAVLSGSVSGVSATLLASDCLIVELWLQWANSATAQPDNSLLLGGLGQYFNGSYTYQILTDTDAVLVAPAPITFS